MEMMIQKCNLFAARLPQLLIQSFLLIVKSISDAKWHVEYENIVNGFGVFKCEPPIWVCVCSIHVSTYHSLSSPLASDSPHLHRILFTQMMCVTPFGNCRERLSICMRSQRLSQHSFTFRSRFDFILNIVTTHSYEVYLSKSIWIFISGQSHAADKRTISRKSNRFHSSL